jgi:hypothetical protein
MARFINHHPGVPPALVLVLAKDEARVGPVSDPLFAPTRRVSLTPALAANSLCQAEAKRYDAQARGSKLPLHRLGTGFGDPVKSSSRIEQTTGMGFWRHFPGST